MRVNAWVEHEDENIGFAIRLPVGYTMAARGFLAPASVLNQHIVDKQLLTENRYRYAPFKIFAGDGGVKFTEQPDSAPQE